MSDTGGLSSQILPPPEAVIHRLWDGFATGGLSIDLAASLTRAGFGFAVGAIAGASGCGKSTLPRLILGPDRGDQGEVRIDGTQIRGPGLDRGMVFQEYRLLPWLTAEQNVAAGKEREAAASHPARLFAIDAAPDEAPPDRIRQILAAQNLVMGRQDGGERPGRDPHPRMDGSGMVGG
jgi:hypothetical protein